MTQVPDCVYGAANASPLQPPLGDADNGGMQDSVALLLTARTGLAQHDEGWVVADLCRSFGVDEADAEAAVFAARLLCDAPGRKGSLSVEPSAELRIHGTLERSEVEPIR